MAVRVLVIALIGLGLAAPAAGARVLVVAAGQRAVLVDVRTDTVAGSLRMPGRARAVAMAPDGSRAWVAAGRDLVTVDLATRAVTSAARLRGAATALAVSPDGARLYALRARAVDVLDPATGARVGAIRIPGMRAAGAGELAVAPSGLRAAVVGRGRVAVVDLAAADVVRRPRVRGAGGVAFDALGRAWVSAPGRLVGLGASSGRPSASVRLGRDGDGDVAAAPDGRRALVAPGRRRVSSVLVDLARRRVLARPRTGAGPGHAAWSPDGARAYATASASVAAVSAFSGRVLRRAPIAGGRPAALAAGPGAT